MDSFMPRSEFVKQDRQPASFALLTLISNNTIQLAHFDFAIIVSLRQLPEPIQTHREIPDQSLYELALQGKPWSNPKSIKSEAAFLSVLSVILSHGYQLLSPIDYGREEHGKLAIVFSRPHSAANRPNTSLSHQVPFAVSFVDKSTLRVISPPLHSTPAILQALRTAWPRGIFSETKIMNDSYEFKLKGYSVLREDTFARDSLIHILNILASFDEAGFGLLASLSISGSHRRIKDLWVFAGKAQLSPSSLADNPGTLQSAFELQAMPFPTVTADYQPQLYGINSQINPKNSTPSQATDMPNGEFHASKYAVLKKHHPREKNQSRSEDGQFEDAVIVESPNSSTGVTVMGTRHCVPTQGSSEMPARILYSTPHLNPLSNNEGVGCENTHQENGGHSGIVGITTVGTIALLAGAPSAATGEDDKREENGLGDNGLKMIDQGSTEKTIATAPRLTNAEGSSLIPGDGGGIGAEDYPNDELPASSVSQDTGCMSLIDCHPSTGSTTLLSQEQAQSSMLHPIIPVELQEEHVNSADINGWHEWVAQSTISAPECPIELNRQITPMVPGGWLPTPGEEKSTTPTNADKTVLETRNMHKHKPQTFQNNGEFINDTGILISASEETEMRPQESIDEMNVPPLQKILAQEEAKIISEIGNSEPKNANSEQPVVQEQLNDEENEVSTDGVNVTSKRSVFKKIFRHVRGTSGSRSVQ